MIERCREAGLSEPEFKLTDGFVTVIRRKAGRLLRLSAG
jgi:predicted HTH transcriptional regulator